jgi:membrane associated rhomboid family serine protease
MGGIGMLIVIAALIAAVVSSGFAALIAQGKGRDPGWFAVAGALFGVVGVLVAAFAEPGEQIRQRQHVQTERRRAEVAARPWMNAEGA